MIIRLLFPCRLGPEQERTTAVGLPHEIFANFKRSLQTAPSPAGVQFLHEAFERVCFLWHKTTSEVSSRLL